MHTPKRTYLYIHTHIPRHVPPHIGYTTVPENRGYHRYISQIFDLSVPFIATGKPINTLRGGIHDFELKDSSTSKLFFTFSIAIIPAIFKKILFTACVSRTFMYYTVLRKITVKLPMLCHG